ncbi:Uncharacterized protein dnm_062120 [Desulfonema magnum]|uniref:Uncharacterized protein n=1 Tax=Desulfonema magnum TaxID=45655 RepID=A0A975BR42_9BACT|nr:Uncharacterized protein dnm_062120 [Desulfonema magnum]
MRIFDIKNKAIFKKAYARHILFRKSPNPFVFRLKIIESYKISWL